MSNRKTRPDAWWAKLKPDQLDAIFAHCESGITLADGVRWLHAEWNVDTSENRLSVWLQKERKDRSNSVLLDEIRADRDRAMLFGKVVGTATAITEANSALLAQIAFEELRKPSQDRNEPRIMACVELGLKAKAQEIKQQSVSLEVDKFKAAIRTKLETGLEALFQEIQGNERAVSKYQELKEELARAA